MNKLFVAFDWTDDYEIFNKKLCVQLAADLRGNMTIANFVNKRREYDNNGNKGQRGKGEEKRIQGKEEEGSLE